MASGFFAVFDDIATLLDDVMTMSKVATKKTAGILGDDLAVNAEKATGFAASRELPVLWAITKGSFINKAIILPAVFLLNYFAPWAIVPILLLGGIYLAYEGAEKVYEYIFPHTHKAHPDDAGSLPAGASKEEILAHEKTKIKSAITTDFILSIEIVIIALGTVLQSSLFVQIIVVTFIAFIATVGVYGLVAVIVRMDDVGYHLIASGNGKKGFKRGFGQMLVNALPKVIRSLSVIGTIALLLVAGGIYTHNIHQIHDMLAFMPTIVMQLLIGMLIGTLALLLMKIVLSIKTALLST